MRQTLDCFCKGIEFTQSHRPEEAIPDSYNKCGPGYHIVGDDFAKTATTKSKPCFIERYPHVQLILI